MVISELLSEITKDLNKNAFEAAQILSFVLGISPSELVLKGKNEVSEKDRDTALSLVKRRLSHEPLQYILGSWEFMSLPFFVSKDALIPRQDTETLVEFVLSETDNSKKTVLDIGTGTGCIPISIAHFKENFVCMGIDISEKAIALAKRNAENLKVSDRVNFVVLDILSAIPENKFDIVVSNPPYIKSEIIDTLMPEVRDFEPKAALDGGSDGLIFYRRICEIAPEILNKGGLLAFEIGFDQGIEVSELMRDHFENVRVIKDLCDNDRVIAGYFKE